MARCAANRCSSSHATVSCYSAADTPRPHLCSPTTLQDPSRDDRALLPDAGVNSPDLIGQLVEVLAHLPVDVDFPYPCSSGLLGSIDGSITALCSGLVLPQRVNSAPSFTTLPSAADNSVRCRRAVWQCPAGSFCGERTLIPKICPAGHFCPPGSSVPTPCPDGSYSGELGLKRVAECKACPRGSECRPGSTSPFQYAAQIGPRPRQAVLRPHAHTKPSQLR